MEKYLDNIEMLRKILLHFHDKVELSIKELGMARRYLFIKEYPAPDFLDIEYKITLEYLKEIVKEKAFDKIKDLALYFADMVIKAEEEMGESIKSCDDDNTKEAKLLQGRSLMDYFQEIIPLNEIRNKRKLVSSLIKAESSPQSLSFLTSGSCSMITWVHSSHFVDVHDLDTFYILNRKNSRLIEIMNFKDFHWFNRGYNECQNHFILSDMSIDRFEKPYNVLINQICEDKIIFDESFKVNLLQWLLCFKIESVDFKCTGIDWSYSLFDKGNEMCFEGFLTLAQKIYYEYLAKKDWVILEVPNGQSWLTTEDPGFSIDVNTFISAGASLHPDPIVFNMGNDSIIYFPLSRDYCLRIQPKEDIGAEEFDEGEEQPLIVRPSSEIEFRTINALTVSTNKEIIISANKGTLEEFVQS